MRNIGDAIADAVADFSDSPSIGDGGAKTVTFFAIANNDGDYLDDDDDFVGLGEYTQVAEGEDDAQSQLESVEDDHPEAGLALQKLQLTIKLEAVADVQTGGDLLNDAYGKVGNQG